MANDTDTPKGYAPFDLYPYNPSQPPAVAYMAMFGIIGVLHLVAMIPYRSWFPLPMIIGCAMQTGAYYFRTLSHDDIRKTLPFLIQNLLLLASPPLLAASIYMTPRRLAIALESQHFLIAPRLLGKLFIIVDIICFATQVAGAIMSGSEDLQEAKNGKLAIIAGLALQMVAFAFFAAWTATLHRRMMCASFDATILSRVKWQRYIYGLYAITLLFFVRNITRLIEYNQGSDGELLSKELYLYLLDGSMMLAIAFVFLVLHPGRVKMKARKYAKKGMVEEEVQLRRFSS
ncbi:RTA1-domain-containing protein [Sarocladium strictum]